MFKTHKVVDNVWIGAKYSSNKFKWTDGSEVSFTNWAEGSPSNTAKKACVQMVPEGSSMGKWVDVTCNKKNLVVCQKMQTWSLSRLQETLLDARKELQGSLDDVRKQLKDSEENRKQLKSSLEDARKELQVSLEDVRKQLKDSKKNREQLKSSLENARKELQDSLEDVRKQLKDSEKNREQLKSSHEDARKELQGSLEDVRKQLKDSEKNREQLKSSLEDARKELQDSLEDVRKQLKDSKTNREQLKSSLEDARNHINNIELNPVPIGFIYIELPGQPKAETLWPNAHWRDISSDYTGLIWIPMALNLVNSEVRPRNQAMRICKRIN